MWLLRCCCITAAALAALGGHRVRAYPLQDTTLGLNEIKWSSEISGVFLGSPSVLRLATGDLLASFEEFYGGPLPECSPGLPSDAAASSVVDAAGGAGPRAAWDATRGDAHPDIKREAKRAPEGLDSGIHYTYIWHSADNGTTWTPRGSGIPYMHFMSLFSLPADVLPPSSAFNTTAVYAMGTVECALEGKSGVGGGISVSRDGGETWTTQVVTECLNYQTGPMPALFNNGRIYRAIENLDGAWGSGYQATMVSAPLNASTLMDPSSWTTSDNLPFNNSWIPAAWAANNWTDPGYLEGSAVLGPDGRVYDFLRVNSVPQTNVAAVLQLGEDDVTWTNATLIFFPGGNSKATVRYDPVSKRYISLANYGSDPSCPSMRNILDLVWSDEDDLLSWNVGVPIMQDDTGFLFQDSQRYTGFQYVDWHFDGPNGDNIIFVIRTSYRGADSYHNSNRVTYKVLSNWRSLLEE